MKCPSPSLTGTRWNFATTVLTPHAHPLPPEENVNLENSATCDAQHHIMMKIPKNPQATYGVLRNQFGQAQGRHLLAYFGLRRHCALELATMESAKTMVGLWPRWFLVGPTCQLTDLHCYAWVFLLSRIYANVIFFMRAVGSKACASFGSSAAASHES